MELKFEDSLSQEDRRHLVPIGGLSRSGLTASWHSLEGGSDEESEPGSEKFHGSQGDLLQEMRVHAMPNHLMAPKHGYQLSYELALDNMLTPFVSPASPPYGMTYVCYYCALFQTVSLVMSLGIPPSYLVPIVGPQPTLAM